MSEEGPPRDASPIVAQVTDPGRRLSMTSVIVNTLEYCRLIHARCVTAASPTTQMVGRRHHAFAVVLMRIIRDSEFPADTEDALKNAIRRVVKKEWLTDLDRLPREKKRDLLVTLLQSVEKLCDAVYALETGGYLPESNPEVEADAFEFFEKTAETILNSDLSDKEKREEVSKEWMEQMRPHRLTATEAAIDVLCKVLRESHLAKHELRAAMAMLQKQAVRFNPDRSPIPKTLLETHHSLQERLR